MYYNWMFSIYRTKIFNVESLFNHRWICNMYQILREIISLKSPEKILFVIFQFLRWDRFLLCFGTLHMELSCMIKNKKYIDAGVKDARMIDYTSKIYVILQQALIHNKILSNCEEFVKSNILELFETYPVHVVFMSQT